MISNVSSLVGGNSLQQIQQLVGQQEIVQGNRVSSSEQQNELTEIAAAANEFESVFLSLMLKEMRNTLDKENGGLFAGEGSDTFGGMFDMYMSQHLAKSQPLGLGDAVGRALQGYAQTNDS
jgi:Rod binding domain-containing protein